MTDPKPIAADDVVAELRGGAPHTHNDTYYYRLDHVEAAALVDQYAAQRFADAAAECVQLRERVATLEAEAKWRNAPDPFATLAVTEVGDDSDGNPTVNLIGTREQVAIAARWVGMAVALSGSPDLLNAYRREASEDAKTITALKAERDQWQTAAEDALLKFRGAVEHHENLSAEIDRVRAECAANRRTIARLEATLADAQVKP